MRTRVTDLKALLVENRQEHQVIFDNHVPQHPGKLPLRDKRVDALSAQQSVQAPGKPFLLPRQSAVVLQQCHGWIELILYRFLFLRCKRRSRLDVNMLVKTAKVTDAAL